MQALPDVRLMTRLPLLALLVLAACATPAAPSGGPADTTPPALAGSLPETGATRVADSTLTLTFSERLDPSARTAVTVAPTGDTAPEVTVRGRELRVALPGLRDSTTYVVTVGTALKDNHGVALRAPITSAFATGDAIDAARIAGVVRQPETGAGVPLAVWAYALADSAATPATGGAPDYRTETGADGAFSLEYLRPGPYAVVAVADGNRNLRADPGERFAVAPRPAVRADTADAAPLALWVTTQDSIPPRAQRVRPASERRFSVRFDEPVQLRDISAEGSTVADSASGRTAAVQVYQPADAPFEVFVVTETPLAPTPHRVSFRPAVAARARRLGRPVARPFSLSFTPPTRPDTVQSRFLGFVPSALGDTVTVLRPGDVPRVRFSAPLSPVDRAARITIAADGQRLAMAFTTADGVTFAPVRPDSAALPSRFTVSVQTPDSTFRQRFAIAGERETGGLVGRVDASGGPVVVEVRPESGEPITARAGDDGAFSVQDLLPGPYTLRVLARPRRRRPVERRRAGAVPSARAAGAGPGGRRGPRPLGDRGPPDHAMTLTPLLGADAMRAADQATIRDWNVPARVLMETAGRAATREVLARWPEIRTATVLVGTGNNGGDGLVVARVLPARGAPGAHGRSGGRGHARPQREPRPAAPTRRRRRPGRDRHRRRPPPAGRRADDLVVDALLGHRRARRPARARRVAVPVDGGAARARRRRSTCPPAWTRRRAPPPTARPGRR